MNKKITPQERRERLWSLPERLRDIITSVDNSNKYSDLKNSHSLRVDQLGELKDEINLTMLGFNETEGFQKRVQKRLGLNDEEARKLTADVNKMFFEEVRSLMRGGSQGKTEESRENEGAVLDRTQDKQKGTEDDKIKEKLQIRDLPGEEDKKTTADKEEEGNKEELNKDEVLREIEGAGEEKIEMDEDKSFLKGNISEESSAGETIDKGVEEKVVNKKLGGISKGEVDEEERNIGEDEEDKPDKKETKQKPSPGVDPYREPIE